MTRIYPFNPTDKINSFLDRDAHVENDMDAILNDPDALAVNALTADQLAEELNDIQIRVDKKIDLVTRMIGADNDFLEKKTECSRNHFAERYSPWPHTFFVWARGHLRAWFSRPRSPRAIGNNKELNYFAISVAASILCVTAIVGVYSYQKHSRSESIREEISNLHLKRLVEVVERISSQDEFLMTINKKLSSVEEKLKHLDQVGYIDRTQLSDKSNIDQKDRKLNEILEKISDQQNLINISNRVLRVSEMNNAIYHTWNRPFGFSDTRTSLSVSKDAPVIPELPVLAATAASTGAIWNPVELNRAISIGILFGMHTSNLHNSDVGAGTRFTLREKTAPTYVGQAKAEVSNLRKPF